MTLHNLMKNTEKVVSDNAPLILTGIGVAGMVSTAILTGKAAFKSAQILEAVELDKVKNWPKTREELLNGSTLTGKEKFELLYKLYIPAVTTGVLTAACIIGANRIGTRRATALAAAYSLSDRAFTEYKHKVIEKLGESKERAVRDEIAQDRVNRHEPPASLIVATDDGLVLCHDAFSNQYFKSDMETLRKAMNDVNTQILHSDYATVNDFYDAVGSKDLEHTSVSGDLGWNTDKTLDLEFSTVLYKDRTPCISFNFATVPIRDPWRFC